MLFHLHWQLHHHVDNALPAGSEVKALRQTDPEQTRRHTLRRRVHTPSSGCLCLSTQEAKPTLFPHYLFMNTAAGCGGEHNNYLSTNGVTLNNDKPNSESKLLYRVSLTPVLMVVQ